MGSIIDEIGPWSEIKLEIVKNYASAYTTIMAKQKNPSFNYAYIDAFAGPGVHRSRVSGDFVAGSPLNALRVQPEFHDYYFIDIDRKKIDGLEKIKAAKKAQIHLYEGDCNNILINKIFPLIKFKNYKRALCLLDPYGLHISWDVIKIAGSLKTIEIFYNLSILDMNLNILLRNPEKVKKGQKERMDFCWGDRSWYSAVYQENGNLFHFAEKGGNDNQKIADAFKERLKKIAGFSYVPDPIPMRNSSGNIIYYLYFASQKPVAKEIVEDIFNKYRNGGA